MLPVTLSSLVVSFPSPWSEITMRHTVDFYLRKLMKEISRKIKMVYGRYILLKTAQSVNTLWREKKKIKKWNRDFF